MEKQIVLREPITWKQYGHPQTFSYGFTGYCPSQIAIMNISYDHKKGNWLVKVGKYYYGSEVNSDQAKAVAEKIFTDWLNSIAQPEDILTVKEK